jgi:hypothetical protein
LQVPRLLAGVLVASLLIAAEASAAVPRTIVRTANPISALAHDAGRIAFIAGKEFDVYQTYCMQVRTRKIGAPRGISLRRTCADSYPTGLLVLGAGRAVWMEDVGGSVRTWSIYTAAVADRRLKWLTEFEQTGGAGDHPILAGDGRTLALAWASSDVPAGDETNCLDDDVPCRFTVVGGGARRVVGGTTVRIPGVPPAAYFAASAGRIAVVPADRTIRSSPVPRAVEGGPVQIRDAVTGTLVSSFAPTGTVRAVALSSRIAAVLVTEAGVRRIDRYDAVNGALLGKTIVPAATAELELAGRTVVFRAGKSIWILRGASGIPKRLWTAHRVPFDLSIEDRRVIWAVNGNGRGSVSSLLLPRLR